MTTLKLTEDDTLTWFVANGWHDTEAEFTDTEIARIRAAQTEWDAVQDLIFHRVNGHKRGTYPDEDQT